MATTMTVNGVVYTVIGLIDPNTGALLSKAEDAQHASGDGGIPALVVRKDTPAALAGADGDYTLLLSDSAGRLWVRPVGSDATNNLMKIGELCAAGNAPINASGQLIAAGVGKISRAIFNNDHATNKATFQLYDNTSAAGTKLGPLITVPALSSYVLELHIPYAIGVYCAIGGTGTPEAFGISQAVI